MATGWPWAPGPPPTRAPTARPGRFGPRWRVLRSTALGQNEGLAVLALPKAAKEDIKNGYVLHPGLMDLATSGWLMQSIFIMSTALCVPFAVLTFGAAFDLWKMNLKGETSAIDEVPAH